MLYPANLSILPQSNSEVSTEFNGELKFGISYTNYFFKSTKILLTERSPAWSNILLSVG